ncbi:hypothetical protein V491_01447 [Pseudogymnoascus sp. VKM F-3775]|nr:hypothetical protein V491_01447 [Pseudogymnoascus sp. VKM F-3775]
MQFGLETCITEILCPGDQITKSLRSPPPHAPCNPRDTSSDKAEIMGVENKKTRTKTRRHTRDLDQVKSDMLSSKHLAQYQATKASEDLPGLGQFYCVECAKWFEGENSQRTHLKGKNHKRRVKALKEEPYSQKEAEAAVGLRTDNGPLRASKPQTIEVEMAT